jgi:hypothetical protein
MDDKDKTQQSTQDTRKRPVGRPITRFEPPTVIVTRCQNYLFTYLKGISPFLGPTLGSMFEMMFERFITEKPWEHGLPWKKPKIVMSQTDDRERNDWQQVNINLSPDLAEKVKNVASLCGVSKASFCYTGMYWWAQYIYPPNKIMPKKE